MNDTWNIGLDWSPPEGFYPWQPLADVPQQPAVYVIRCCSWAKQMQGDSKAPLDRCPWREPGVIYVGQTKALGTRMTQLLHTLEHPEARSRHPCAFRIRGLAANYKPFGECLGAPHQQLSVSWTSPATRAPDGVPAGHARWQAATKQAREAVESLLIADVISHRLATGLERYLLLNHVDLKTWRAIRP